MKNHYIQKEVIQYPKATMIALCLHLVLGRHNEREQMARKQEITFQKIVVEDTADRMPETGENTCHSSENETFLTCLSMSMQYSTVYRPRFHRTSFRFWKHFCPMNKVKKIHGFSKCTGCKELRAALETAMTTNTRTTAAKASEMQHIGLGRRELLEYKRKTGQLCIRKSTAV